jgi:hypothetical protein
MQLINKAIRLLKNQRLYILTAVLCFILIFIKSYYSIDPDFGWHLQAGKYILNKGIPTYDVFTFTATNFKWINHEWLNDVLIYTIFNSGGYIVTAMFFTSIWTFGLLIAKRTNIKFALLLATVSVLPFAGIRPVAWTVFFIAILERIITTKKKRLQFILPALFLLWANLHGSFVLGLLILLLYQIFSAYKLRWYILLFSFLAVFVNPYGIYVFEEIIRTGADSQLRFKITEWMPVLLPYVSVSYVVITVALVLAFKKRAWKSIFSIPSLTLLMTISSIRHLPVFVATSVRYLEHYQTVSINKLKTIKPTKEINRVIWTSLSVLWLIVIVSSVVSVRGAIYQPEKYPTKAVAYLKENSCKGNIFNSYNYGGYLIWQLPDVKVYIDGRMPSWVNNNQNYFNDYLDFINKEESRKEQINKYNIRCVLVSNDEAYPKNNKSKPLGEWLVSNNWELITSASSQSNSLFMLKP